MLSAFDLSTIAAYAQIIAINIVLSGDNVVVIGMAAASLSPELRGKAIVVGIASAAVIRIIFAIVAVKLLAITGLLLLGGLLLLWVCWNMLRELRQGDHDAASAGAGDDDPAASGDRPRKALGRAILQIVVADVSMSLDNVLAVAGAAEQNMSALVFGLILSVLLMGLAASLVARLMGRYRWIGWAGLAVITYVAGSMIYEGGIQVLGHEGEGGAIAQVHKLPAD